MAWAKRKKSKRRVHPYRGFNMASKAEVKFAEHMDSLGIVWLYEPERLDWIPPCRKYTPDFTLMKKDGNTMYIEYKGYLRPEDKTKMAAIRKQYPNLDIRFVFQNASKPSYTGSKSTYADWAMAHGYKWCEGTLPEEWLKEVR